MVPSGGWQPRGGRPQAGAKRSLRPSLRRTERNHRVDAQVPATTNAAVTAVESSRNILGGARGGGENGTGGRSLRRTERNHRVDAQVPATTNAAVTAVESSRNILVGSVAIITARSAVRSEERRVAKKVRSWL